MLENTLEDTDTSVGTIPYEEVAPGDNERLTHIINPPSNIHIWEPGMSSQDIVDIARATNQEVVSMCGKRWVPKYNPEKFDVCPTCMEIAGSIIRDMG